MKTCTRCHQDKPLDAFPPRRTARDGRQSWCRACTNVAKTAWAARHPERQAAYQRTWHANHPETMRSARRRWRLADQQRRADQPRPPVQPRVAQRKRRAMRRVE